MLDGEFIKSQNAIFPNLKVAEYHDGGRSVYAFGKNFKKDGDGNFFMSGTSSPLSWDPSVGGFAMILQKYASPMDYAEMSSVCDTWAIRVNKDKLRDIKRMHTGGDKNWYGGFTKFTDGFDMICDGWEDGAAKAVKTLLDAKVPDVEGIASMRRTLMFSDSGETLNLDQAMAGNWEKAWQTCRRIKSGSSRVLSIAIPFGGNCVMTSEQLFWNGAQGMIITDILEDKGYRVQLYGVYASNQEADGRMWDIDVVELKKSEDPLRMDTIAAIVAHAGVFRTAGFAAILSRPCKISLGLGHCLEGQVPQAVEALTKLGHMHPDTFTLDAAYNKEDARKRISEFFERMKKRSVEN